MAVVVTNLRLDTLYPNTLNADIVNAYVEKPDKPVTNCVVELGAIDLISARLVMDRGLISSTTIHTSA